MKKQKVFFCCSYICYVCAICWVIPSGSAGCSSNQLNQKCMGKIQILFTFNVNNLFSKFLVKNTMLNFLRARWINKCMLKVWKVLLVYE